MRSLAFVILSALFFVGCHAHDSPPSPTPTAAAAAPAPTRAARREAITADGCRACRGEWAAHGMLGKMSTMSCLCPTGDAGKRCRDGAECEGECLTDGVEHEVAIAGPPALGYFVGRCSRFHTNFGCHRAIASGALKAGPISLDHPPTEICAD